MIILVNNIIKTFQNVIYLDKRQVIILIAAELEIEITHLAILGESR